MFINVTRAPRFFSRSRRYRNVIINTDTVKKVTPIDRYYSEDVSRIHFEDGEVMDTTMYYSEWTKLELVGGTKK